MLTFDNRRRFVLSLVVVLALSFAFTVPAAASSVVSSNVLTVPAQVWVLVWNVLTQGSAALNEEVSPPGTSTLGSSSISPIGSSKD